MRRVWKYLIVLVIGGLLGGGVGFAAGIFVYPYIFLADVVANEQVENAASRTVVATGDFIHADPSDPVHYGKGGVTAYADMVHLAADFEVGPGPKYHVYLMTKPNIGSTDDVKAELKKSAFVDLGRLRAFKGSQVYEVPPGIDVKSQGSVVIWCEAFGVLISPATLTFKE